MGLTWFRLAVEIRDAAREATDVIGAKPTPANDIVYDQAIAA